MRAAPPISVAWAGKKALAKVGDSDGADRPPDWAGGDTAPRLPGQFGGGG